MKGGGFLNYISQVFLKLNWGLLGVNIFLRIKLLNIGTTCVVYIFMWFSASASNLYKSKILIGKNGRAHLIRNGLIFGLHEYISKLSISSNPADFPEAFLPYFLLCSWEVTGDLFHLLSFHIVFQILCVCGGGGTGHQLVVWENELCGVAEKWKERSFQWIFL